MCEREREEKGSKHSLLDNWIEAKEEGVDYPTPIHLPHALGTMSTNLVLPSNMPVSKKDPVPTLGVVRRDWEGSMVSLTLFLFHVRVLFPKHRCALFLCDDTYLPSPCPFLLMCLSCCQSILWAVSLQHPLVPPYNFPRSVVWCPSLICKEKRPWLTKKMTEVPTVLRQGEDKSGVLGAVKRANRTTRQ